MVSRFIITLSCKWPLPLHFRKLRPFSGKWMILIVWRHSAKTALKAARDASHTTVWCGKQPSLFMIYSRGTVLFQAMVSIGDVPMKRMIAIASALLMAGTLAACNTPGERAAGGALIGGAAGAAIGGLATGRVGGAVAGGIIGAAGGAIVGSATAPQPVCPYRAPYLRYDAYGNPYCSYR